MWCWHSAVRLQRHYSRRPAACPVGAGFVDNLARPGGNATGFASSEFGFGGKWLELLKEIAPGLTRVAVMRDAAIASQMGLLGAMQSLAPSLRIQLRPIDMRDAGDIEPVAAVQRVVAGAADERVVASGTVDGRHDGAPCCR